MKRSVVLAGVWCEQTQHICRYDIHVCMYVYAYIYIYICMFIYIYMYVYIYIHIYIYSISSIIYYIEIMIICVCMYVYMYIYIYIYIYVSTALLRCPRPVSTRAVKPHVVPPLAHLAKGGSIESVLTCPDLKTSERGARIAEPRLA